MVVVGWLVDVVDDVVVDDVVVVGRVVVVVLLVVVVVVVVVVVPYELQLLSGPGSPQKNPIGNVMGGIVLALKVSSWGGL